MPADDFDIPELNRIGSLMRDLLPDTGAAAARPRTHRKAAAAPPGRVAAATLARFADGVNWRNAEGFRSPFAATAEATPARSLGGLSLAAFAAGANWTNAPDGSRLVTVAPGAVPGGPPETLESFMDSFGWD